MPQLPVSVDHVQEVAAGPAEVWALVADASQRPGWMTELRRVDARPGAVEEGDRFVGESSILFHDFVGASEVTVADPPKLLVEEVVIGARFVSRWEVAPAASGHTTVRHSIVVEFPAGPFSRLERWVLRRRLLRMQQVSLRNLATQLSRSAR